MATQPAFDHPISVEEYLSTVFEHDCEVQTKGYGNVSEYVRGLLREAQTREADARLEALLIEGLASGEEIPLTPGFWSELKQDAAKILARHNQPGKARSEL